MGKKAEANNSGVTIFDLFSNNPFGLRLTIKMIFKLLMDQQLDALNTLVRIASSKQSDLRDASIIDLIVGFFYNENLTEDQNNNIFSLRNEIASALIKNTNIDINQRIDGLGMSLLHLSASCQNSVITEMLIKVGANIDAVDDSGNTPLFCAFNCLKGEPPHVARKLIESGADVSKIINKTDRALYTALKHYDLDIAEILIKKGQIIDKESQNKFPDLLDEVISNIKKESAEIAINQTFNESPDESFQKLTSRAI